jgi:hypothetical protein
MAVHQFLSFLSNRDMDFDSIGMVSIELFGSEYQEVLRSL